MTKIGIVIEKEDTSMTIIGAVKKSGSSIIELPVFMKFLLAGIHERIYSYEKAPEIFRCYKNS